MLVNKGKLPISDPPKDGPFLKGKEHIVVYDTYRVLKYPMRQTALTPYLEKDRRLSVRPSTEEEYLSRLHLANEYFSDEITVVGVQSNGRLVIAQPLIQGTEPSDKDIEKYMKRAGFHRVAYPKMNLPHKLMMTAWCHAGAGLIVVDARPPNFKKTEKGNIFAIDLMIAQISKEDAKYLISP